MKPSFTVSVNSAEILAARKNLLSVPVACDHSCDTPCSHARPHPILDCMTVPKRQDCPACDLVYAVIENERELP